MLVSLFVIYSDKLKTISSFIKELIKDSIDFIGDEDYYQMINDSCDENPNCTNLCAAGTDCKIILPEKNLIVNHNFMVFQITKKFISVFQSILHSEFH